MAQLVQIGNSRGLRIPKVLIEQAGIGDHELELRVTDEGLLVTPIRPCRQGWEAAFQAMHEAGDDALLLDDEAGNTFDEDEWEW